MKKTVKILGTKYTLRKVDFGKDKYIDENGLGGYCNSTSKEIVIINFKTIPMMSDEPQEVLDRKERETIRHEIIHAFLHESGLGWNSLPIEKAWAQNEEMVDWIAMQFPKILKVFKELGCEGE